MLKLVVLEIHFCAFTDVILFNEDVVCVCWDRGRGVVDEC